MQPLGRAVIKDSALQQQIEIIKDNTDPLTQKRGTPMADE
jgi:hypothetical protein